MNYPKRHAYTDYTGVSYAQKNSFPINSNFIPKNSNCKMIYYDNENRKRLMKYII